MTEPDSTARAVLVAAGNATRMGAAGGVRKPLLELGGRPLLEHACAALAAARRVSSIVIVAHPDDRETVSELVARSKSCAKVVALVPGGAERIDSVRLGCQAAPEAGRAEPPFAYLCIHDAARPFVPAAAIDAAIEAAASRGAALVAIPVADTLKRSSDGVCVERTVERDGLWAAQTPQVFERARFIECLERARSERLTATDDAALWERYVGPVAITRGDATCLKITSPTDLELARALEAFRNPAQRGSHA